MSINDLAFAMVKKKEDKQAIKKLEKKIQSWENEKSYPTLDDVYQMAYHIKINPGEFLAIRNRGRKQFFKGPGDTPTKRHDWIEISDNASIIFSSVSKLFGIVAIFLTVVVGAKFMDTFYGSTATEVEIDVMERQIQKSTDPDNMINDGTVTNMIRRKNRERQERLSGENSNITNIVNQTEYNIDEVNEIGSNIIEN